MAEKKPELQRGLEARHIELIALGGTIGVGLFMGSASTLKWAGPSVLLAYIIAGLFVFFIMRSMGEMLFLEPVTGSFAVYAHRYMSPFFGYLTARPKSLYAAVTAARKIIPTNSDMRVSSLKYIPINTQIRNAIVK